jgi:mycothiol system anti-sigma-R factor
MDEEVEPVDCRTAVERLYTYLDGELTEERRAVITMHLDGCHHCLEAFEFEHVLRATIKNRCQETVPADLLARIAAALEQEAGS